MENKKMMYLVIILSILVVGLGGYIVYDKILSVDNNSNATNNDLDNNVNYSSGYLLDMLSESDKNKLDDSNNYKNIEVLINGLLLTFNCTGFGGNPGNYCYHTEILLNKNRVHEYDTVVGDINTNPYIIITDKYFIIQRIDSYEVEIFDKNGNSLKLIEDVVYSYKKVTDDNYTNKSMYLEDDKLYFYVYDGESLNDSSLHKINLKYIDLSNSNFSIIDSGNSFDGNLSCKEC